MKPRYTAAIWIFLSYSSMANTRELRHDSWTDSSGAMAHIITIDPTYYELQIVVDPAGITTRPCEMAQRHFAVAAMNAGFFAFPGSSEDDEVKCWIRKESVADGNLITREHTHELSRDELPTFAWSETGTAEIANVSQTMPWLPPWAQYAINGMPVLLQDGMPVEQDIDTLNAVAGGNRRPRSALCMGLDGRFRLFVISAATIESIVELAEKIGCKDAINLDGGPSTSLDYQGRSLMHRSCFLERPVHSSIIVKRK